MPNIPNRFYSLDVLRGLAALGVVLWHWQHFFSPFNKQGVIFSVDKQPFFDALYFFYKNGHAAVQLFFCLSGFIFFWLYAQRIADKVISLKSFSVLRLSRLYPLHFATLVFVAIGQFAYTSITNSSFVYPFNDVYHILLNLFFASSWGFEKGFSFNAPIWSVSVEVLLYLMFFVFCRGFKENMTAVISAIFFGYLIHGFNTSIGSGIMYFFLGGLVFIVYKKLIKYRDPLNISIWLPFIASVAWFALIVSSSPNHGIKFSEHHFVAQKIFNNFSIILFPITIMSLALIESKRGNFSKRFSFLGDISYSSYLLHFPLQLTAALVAAEMGINQGVFYSPWFMALFFFVLILVSLASHHYFEIPIQRYLRRQRPKLALNKNAGR